MENKARARRKEAEILRTFDYAWNKGCNGARRHDDTLRKLDKHALNPKKLPNLSRKHLPFRQKQVGIKIKTTEMVLQGNKFSQYANGEICNSSWQVSKFSGSLHRSVLDHGGSDEDYTITCGVVLEDGSICGRPPAEGRKRCAEHKGKRMSTSEKSQTHKARLEYDLDSWEFNVHGAKIPSFGLAPSLARNFPKIEQYSPIFEVAKEMEGVGSSNWSSQEEIPMFGFSSKKIKLKLFAT